MATPGTMTFPFLISEYPCGLHITGLRSRGKKAPTKASSEESPIVLTGHAHCSTQHPSFIFFFFFFLAFRAAPAAHGSSQARDRIRATAVSLYNRHSNSGSKPRVLPIPQFTAMPDPQPTEWGQGSNPHSRGYQTGSLPLSYNRNSLSFNFYQTQLRIHHCPRRLSGGRSPYQQETLQKKRRLIIGEFNPNNFKLVIFKKETSDNSELKTKTNKQKTQSLEYYQTEISLC